MGMDGKAANAALSASRSALTFRMQVALDEQQQLARAARIKQLREESPYTQAALADLVGVTPRAYQRWEEGGGIEWEHLERLAEVHGVDVIWIHRGTSRGPTPDPFVPTTSEVPALARIEAKLARIEDRQTRLLAAVGKLQAAQQSRPSPRRQAGSAKASPRND